MKKADDVAEDLAKELELAQDKALDALGRYKFTMFGYWAGIWVHLNRILGARQANPFAEVVKAARRGLNQAGLLQPAQVDHEEEQELMQLDPAIQLNPAAYLAAAEKAGNSFLKRTLTPVEPKEIPLGTVGEAAAEFVRQIQDDRIVLKHRLQILRDYLTDDDLDSARGRDCWKEIRARLEDELTRAEREVHQLTTLL